MRVSDLGVIASDVVGWPESLGAGPAITRVSDGDTIQLRDLEGVRHKIRLAKIDAPESKQEWGREAAEMLRGLVGDKMVRNRAGCQPTGRRGHRSVDDERRKVRI